MTEFKNEDGSPATWLEVLPEDVRRRRLWQEIAWSVVLGGASVAGFAVLGMVGAAYLALSGLLLTALLVRVIRRFATGVVRHYSEETVLVRGELLVQLTVAASLARRYYEPALWELRAWRSKMGWVLSALAVAAGAALVLGLKYIPHFGAAIAIVLWELNGESYPRRRP